MLPAASQGAIGIEIRGDDETLEKLLQPLNAPASALCVNAERAFLTVLDGSCATPIGALARLTGDTLTLEGLTARPDGSAVHRLSISGAAKDAEQLGAELGRRMKAQLPPGFLAG